MDAKQLALTEEQPITIKKLEYTVRAKQVLKRTVEDIIELSQICVEYHKEFGYKEYVCWVKDELGLSKSYGCNLLNIFEKYGSSPHCGLISNFDSSAIRLLAESTDQAREEASSLAEQGEHISHAKAKEIVAKHKAELATKQQAITSLEDQIKALQAERHEIIIERDQMRLNKQADDADIIRQNELVDKLNKQIEEFKSKVAEPQIIEKEVEKIVEKQVEIIPGDYEQIKEKLKATSKEIDSLTKKLARKEELLSSFENEQRQANGLQKVNDGMKYIEEAYILLKDQNLNEYMQEIIENGLKSLTRIFSNLFEDKKND